MKIVFAALFLSATCTYAQKEYALQLVDTLCSSHFDGRGYVNRGGVRSADFIVDELRRIGVQPLPGKPYTQAYTFDVNTFPHPIEVVLGGDTLLPGTDYLVHPISGSAVGTFNVVEVDGASPHGSLQHVRSALAALSQPVLAIRAAGIEAEQRKKALAVAHQATAYAPVIYVTDQKQMYGVSREATSYPLITVNADAYQKARQVTLRITNQYVRNDTSKNVIGWIPGKKKKKYIVFSAHYDHLGRMGPATYFPGANDNASGVAMLLSLAKHYCRNQPLYSIAFCFFSGEEAGLLGSDYFVKHPYFPLKEVEFVLNIDIMGGASKGIAVVNGTRHEEAFDQLVAINQRHQLLETVKKRGAAANSDHHSFSERGVPAFFIYSMGEVKNYHDIYDTAENTPLHQFDEVQRLLELFVRQLR